MENANASNATAAPNDEELRRLNRAYRALSLCNGEIARATSEQQLRNALCETLVNVGGYPLAWIGFAEPESFRVKPVALAGDAAAQPYLDSIHVTWADDEHGRGPTGVAFRSRQPAINRDSSNNPEYGPWRDQALRFGLRSSIALPLLFRPTTRSVAQPFFRSRSRPCCCCASCAKCSMLIRDRCDAIG